MAHLRTMKMKVILLFTSIALQCLTRVFSTAAVSAATTTQVAGVVVVVDLPRGGAAAAASTGVQHGPTPPKSDRERGWPPWYPRKFPPPPPRTLSPPTTKDASSLSSSSSTGDNRTVAAPVVVLEEDDTTLRREPEETEAASSVEPSESNMSRTSMIRHSSSSVSSSSSSLSAAASPPPPHREETTPPRRRRLFRRRKKIFVDTEPPPDEKDSNNETKRMEIIKEEKETTTITTTTVIQGLDERSDRNSSRALSEEEEEKDEKGGVQESPASVVVARQNGTVLDLNRTLIMMDMQSNGNGTVSNASSHSLSLLGVNNTTATTAPSNPEGMLSPVQRHGMILLGSAAHPPTPYRIYPRRSGGGVAILPPPPGSLDPTRTRPIDPPGDGSGNAGRLIMMHDLAGSVLSSVARILLLRSIRAWLSQQDEVIAPVQHFCWERLNDKFVRDAAALSTVLQQPPPPPLLLLERKNAARSSSSSSSFSRRAWRRQLRKRHRLVRHQERSRRMTLQKLQEEERNRRSRNETLALTTTDDNDDDTIIISQDVRRVSAAPAAFDPATVFLRTVVVVELTSSEGGGGKDGGLDSEYLAEVVTFLLSQHRNHAFGTNATTLQPNELEVVLLVQSPGGSVATFGLAAAHVRSLSTEPGIVTTVCVDQYAASGGYMIASQASPHQLMAAPFASIGSIGVMMEGLNFHDLARNWGIQPLVIKAGEFKNPMSTFGSVTKHDLDHQKEQLDKVHVAFKQLVLQGRPVLETTLDQVANGNVFLGEEAYTLNLVDKVKTSARYILERVEAGDRVLKLHKCSPPSSRLARRAMGQFSPADLLPHLLQQSSSHHHIVQLFAGVTREQWSSWFVQSASFLSLLHHFYCRYYRRY